MTGVSLFYYQLFQHIGLFYFYSILFLIIYYSLLRKYIYSFFDPFLLTCISIYFGSVDIFFMHHVGTISDYYFFHYVFTQILFILGFFSFKPIKLKKLVFQSSSQSIHSDRETATILYCMSSVIFVFTQLISFILAGIPILMEARLLAYAGGGGIGILSRIIVITSSITLFLLINRKYSTHKLSIAEKLYDAFIFIFIIISLLSGGARSALLDIVYTGFLYGLFICRFKEYTGVFNLIRKNLKIFFLFAFIGALIVFTIGLRREGNELHPLFAMILRFIQSGDIFMYAYQDNVIEQMKRANPLIVMFADALGMFRVMSWSDIPTELGNQLHRYHMGNDLPMGPNPVHNVFGLFYFGYAGSLIYSFMIGWLLSFIRNKMIFFLPKTILGGLFFVLVTNALLAIPIDFSYAIHRLDNIIIIGIPLILFSTIVTCAIKSKQVHYIQHIYKPQYGIN
jgi:hypothetical protein